MFSHLNHTHAGTRSVKILTKKMVEALQEEKKTAFRRDQAERLGVSSEVISTIMAIEQGKAIRKRVALLCEMDECKDRIFKALQMGTEEEEDLTMFEPCITQDVLRSKINALIFAERVGRDNEKWFRHKEQSEILSFINFHLARCQENFADMDEMIEWMAKFTYEITWDDIDVRPIDDREAEEEASFRRMYLALQQTWQCTKKLTQLIEMLASDDKYDYMAGKIPEQLLALAKRKKYSFAELWSSNNLRTKMNKFEKLRSEIKVDPKRPDLAVAQRKITVLQSGDALSSTELKKLEAAILKEISESWKEASGDIAFYLKESFFHNFTKHSCQKRLKRALLLLEFLTAAIEGKITDADRTLEALEDSQTKFKSLRKESRKIQKQLNEVQKELASSKQAAKKLKNQIKTISKENESLTLKTAEYDNEIKNLEQSIMEYKTRPSPDEMNKQQANLEILKDDLKTLKVSHSKLKDDLINKSEEIEKLRLRLASSKKLQVELREEMANLKAEKEAALKQIGLLREQISLHDFRMRQLQDSLETDEKARKSQEFSVDNEESHKLKTLSSTWSLESEKQTKQTSSKSDSYETESSSKKKPSKKHTETPALQAIQSEEKNETEIGFRETESQSTLYTKRDSSMLQAFEDTMSFRLTDVVAATVAPKKEPLDREVKILPEVEVENSSVAEPKKLSREAKETIPFFSQPIQQNTLSTSPQRPVSNPPVEDSPTTERYSPDIDINQHIQNFAMMLTKQLTQAVDKNSHYQSNEDKNEAENEFQLLFESARQTMHSEPRKLKSPRARSKKSKRASPKQDGRPPTVSVTKKQPTTASPEPKYKSKKIASESASSFVRPVTTSPQAQLPLIPTSPSSAAGRSVVIPSQTENTKNSSESLFTSIQHQLENVQNREQGPAEITEAAVEMTSTHPDIRTEAFSAKIKIETAAATLSSIYSENNLQVSYAKTEEENAEKGLHFAHLDSSKIAREKTYEETLEMTSSLAHLNKIKKKAYSQSNKLFSTIADEEQDLKKRNVGGIGTTALKIKPTSQYTGGNETTNQRKKQLKVEVGATISRQPFEELHVNANEQSASPSFHQDFAPLSSPSSADGRSSQFTGKCVSLRSSPLSRAKTTSPQFSLIPPHQVSIRGQRSQPPPPSLASDRSSSTEKHFIKPSAGNKVKKKMTVIHQSTSISFDKLESSSRKYFPKTLSRTSTTDHYQVPQGKNKALIQRVARLGSRRKSSLLDQMKNETDRDAEMSPFVTHIGNIAGISTENLVSSTVAPRSSIVLSNSPSVEESLTQDERSITNDEEQDEDLPSQAEEFAKKISDMISNYFTKLNASLIDSLKREAKRLSEELQKMEDLLNNERLETQARLDTLNKEKLQMEKELNISKQTADKLTKFSKYASMAGSLPKIWSDYIQEKSKLIEMSENLNATMQRTENYSKVLEEKLQVAQFKVRKRGKSIEKQDKEIKMLRQQLASSRDEEIQRLFMSLRSHRVNYKTIMESKEIKPEIKSILLDLLRRSMSYPKYRLSEIFRRYIQKREIDSCMQKIQLQLPDVVRLPPVEMSAQIFKENFDEGERQRLRQILTRLKKRSQVAEDRWKMRMKEMTGRRQKILTRLALLFHKLKSEYKDVDLLQPIVRKIKVRGRPESCLQRFENAAKQAKYETSHLPLPVPDSQRSLHLVSPSFSDVFHELPEVLEMRDHKTPNRPLTLALSEQKSTAEKTMQARICPPFRNITGTACLHRSSFADKAKAFSKYLELPVLSKTQMNDLSQCQTLGIPKMLEMDVQAGLRNAKKILFTRMDRRYRGIVGQRKPPTSTKELRLLLPLVHGGQSIPKKLPQPKIKPDESSTVPLIDQATSAVVNTKSSVDKGLLSGQ